jgi:hypothetical protein
VQLLKNYIEGTANLLNLNTIFLIFLLSMQQPPPVSSTVTIPDNEKDTIKHSLGGKSLKWFHTCLKPYWFKFS